LINQITMSDMPLRKRQFLGGVFLISFAVLVFQIVQTRVLSVVAWYYLAFFAISVAMLGMTVGAVWVYLYRDRFQPGRLATTLSDFSLLTAVSMPASLMVQFSLITSLVPVVSTLVSWSLLLAAMAVPYVFAGVVVSLALTRSPFPVSQVYGMDLLGAALGCVVVVFILNVLDGPSTIILAGLIAGASAASFAISATELERERLHARAWWRHPTPLVLGLLVLTAINAAIPVGIRPIMVKDGLEYDLFSRYEKWNSYSRIVAYRPLMGLPYLWGPSPQMPKDLIARSASVDIDSTAGTTIFNYDGTRESVDFLRFDIVNLAYNLPGISKAVIIGVGGGRDIISAHLYGVPEIVGVELNPIFIRLHMQHPLYKSFSNLTTLPNLRLYVDDARSWFASTQEHFDLIQMSMIDTWAATGAGAFSLSENGLYTLEGWRAFLKTLNEEGVFTVSRWYRPNDINETGRMIGLATAAMLDAGARDVRPHLFVSRAENIATLVLSKRPFRSEQLRILHDETRRLGFDVLLAPDQPPESPLLGAMVAAMDIETLNRVAGGAYLDLTVPTDNRPFFFNQLRFSRIPEVMHGFLTKGWEGGVIWGNLLASVVLMLILFISIVAVICTILLPLRSAARNSSAALITAGTVYFALIGMGFMLAEISMLQYFSIYLGHPIYSLGVCLFSLILATGLGSLASGRIDIASLRGVLTWGLIVGGYLLATQYWITEVFSATTAHDLPMRIAVSLLVVMPLGFLMGFAFPTGMRLVEAVDREPMPWFWGINGATGVLASVLAVTISMAFGINVTMSVAALCYLGLIPVAMVLIGQGHRKAAALGMAAGNVVGCVARIPDNENIW
jgi:hypothetical protein